MRAPADPFVFCFCRGAQRPETADRPNNSSTLKPSYDRKSIISLAPSMATTVPLQIKLTSQRLMVSTQNTSRSNANPPRMQDQPGGMDSRPLGGALETVQANTDEVEVLRVTNQHLLKELEQLTRKIRHPQETRQARKDQNPVTREEQHLDPRR